MKMNVRMLILCSAILFSACARPQAVRTVATTAKPLVANLQRASTLSARHLAMQREDVLRSTARFQAARVQSDSEVSEFTEDWLDQGRKAELDRLARFRTNDASLRSDPLAHLRPISPIEVAPTEISTAGLTAVAKTLDRLEGEKGLSVAQLLSFAREVSDELTKLEEEKASTGTPAASTTP